jgi:hypothetical protein
VTLVPISPWLCLRCGTSQRYGVEPEPCCTEQFAVRVMVDEPPIEAHDPDGVDLDAEGMGALI